MGLFSIAIVFFAFTVIQIVVYCYLFLSHWESIAPDMIGLITLWAIVILVIQGIILELMRRNMKTRIRQNEEEKKLIEKKYEKDYSLLVAEQKKNVKNLQEEMQNELMKVQELFEDPSAEQRAEIQKLLGQMEEKVGKTGKMIFCKDSVLNTMLALKYAKAQKEGLSMNISVDSYTRTNMEVYDLCSIVANLMDNAIEAANRVKESGIKPEPIEVRIGQRAGYLILKVENPVMEPLKKNKKGRYISSKKERSKGIREHGRGIAIVENALEKYGGTLRFEEQDGFVTAMAFMPVAEENLK